MPDSLIPVSPAAATGDLAAASSVSGDGGAQRPDWLPEKFWVDGQPAYDKLATSYRELESAFTGKQDAIKAQLAQELEAQRLAARPEKPDGYTLPEVAGLDQEEFSSHPLTQWWRDFAYEKGFGQEEFEKGIGLYLESVVGAAPDFDAEIAKLGDNAKARTEAVGLWVGQTFAPEEIPAIEKLCTTAEGVKVMEKVMSLVRGEGQPVYAQPEPALTEETVRSMMQDKRYWSAAHRDPAFVKQVESFFQKQYGGGR